MQELEALEKKLELLLKQYAALQAENNALTQKIDKLRHDGATRDGLMADMEARLKTFSVSGTMPGQKEQLKKYLDEVIIIIEQNMTALRS